MDIKPWLTVTEAAAHAGVGKQVVYDACSLGDLRHARVGGRRMIRIRPEWIDAWLEANAPEGIPDGRVDLLGE